MARRKAGGVDDGRLDEGQGTTAYTGAVRGQRVMAPSDESVKEPAPLPEGKVSMSQLMKPKKEQKSRSLAFKRARDNATIVKLQRYIREETDVELRDFFENNKHLDVVESMSVIIQKGLRQLKLELGQANKKAV